MATTLPTIVTSAGLQPQTPASLNAQLIAAVAATNPGYTANLPGSLIEDISSTDTYALVLCDQARVETVNSLTPYGANDFLLNELGQIYGVTPGLETNTSVFVQFTGTPGFVIAQGFTVSDGTFQYVIQDGGVIGAGNPTLGTSPQLFALATQTGSFPVPPDTVTTLVTSVPSIITLSVTNPEAGLPGTGAETAASFRARVLQAGLAGSQGMARYLKTILSEVAGVQPRLVSVLQQAGGGWEILVGGGDPYQVAYAIYTALFDVSTLVGSVLEVVNITNTFPAVVTTNLNHGYTTGQVAEINGAQGLTEVNGVPFTVTVIDEKNFSIGINTVGDPAYTGGGVVAPNLRNIMVSLNDYPDVYAITFVNPPQQTVSITVTWNTTAINFVNQSAVSQLGAPALMDYVNSIPVGAPINLFELQTTFQTAISSVLDPNLLTRMVFAVDINGIGVTPEAGTGIIAGDPESYFFVASTASIVIFQG